MPLNIIASFGDARGMLYPGGKNSAGVYQTIINLMPPDDVYMEPFLGGGAIMRQKRPAPLNIGLDLDVIARFDDAAAGIDISAMLATNSSKATGLLFSAPIPSPAASLSIATRPICTKHGAAPTFYRFEMDDRQHMALLMLSRPCPAACDFRAYDAALCRGPRLALAISADRQKWRCRNLTPPYLPMPPAPPAGPKLTEGQLREVGSRAP